MDMKIIEQIFAADKHVRFVGILASDLKTVLSKARQGLKTTEGKKCSDDSLVNLAAPLFLEPCRILLTNVGSLFVQVLGIMRLL